MPICHLKKVIVLLSLFNSQAFAQNKPLPLQTALKKITRTFGTQFVYDAQIIDGKTTNYNLDTIGKRTVEEVLKAVLYPNNLVFLYVKPKYYTIVPKSGLSEIKPVTAAAEERPTVTGMVTNETGAALPGITITENGTSNGTVTGTDGRYTIRVTSKQSTLSFSSVGYASREVTVGNQTTINLSLQQGSADLASVVVIGYGTARKRDLTGSVGRVSAQEVNAFPTTNVLQSLQGRAAGVMVSQTTGAPGAGISIRIRGANSILGSNEPLYVIDGFPYSGNPTFLQNGDIQSIEILKDASSVAIYGSRGANGVVLITTKNGRKGKTTVDIESAYSIQTVSKKMDLMNAFEYASFYNEQAANDNVTPYFTQAQLDALKQAPGTDWQSLVLHSAPLFNTNINLNGGNDKTQFSISGGVFRQDGIIRNSDYNRYSVRANLTHELSNIFSMSYNATLTRIDSRRQNSGRSNRGADLISGMLNAPPTLSAYKEDGSYRRLNTAYPFISNVIVNPLAIMNEVSDRIKADRLLANAALRIKPLAGLSIRISGGVENSNDRTDYYENVDTTRTTSSSAGVGTTQLTSFLNENVINYTRQIGDHNLNVMTGFTYQDYLTTSLSGSGNSFLSDVPETYNLQGAATPGIPSSGYTKWVLLSYIGRLNYTFKDRYLATISFRRDGSSRYSDGNKWGNFPSAAIAWRISDENFFEALRFVNSLKLRASYGSAGSTAISPYQTLNQLSSSKTIFADAMYNALAPGVILPGDLKWEVTRQWDIGFDAELAGNRIRVTADYYRKRTRNLLNNVQLPASMGYVSTVRNVGEIENKGVELGIEADIIQGRLQWNVTTNFSLNRNKVLKLYGGQDIFGSTIYTGSLNDYINLLREGQPLGIFYGYVEKGYTAAGLLDYEDLNKDNRISAADKTYIGDPNADFIYSVNSVLAYKGFELTLFLQGSQGNDIFNLNAAQAVDLGMGLNLPRELYYNHWTPANTNTKYGKVTRLLNGNMSTRLVEDGSYLRFKNIQLAYSMPVNNQRRPWLRSAQLYVSAQNMITITGYSWYDPDVNAYGGANSINQGIDYLSYPNSKSITFGIRCGF